MNRRIPLRWIAVGVFALSSSLNFLDRQILAALAPQLMQEFSMSAGDYGDVLFAFSILYAICAPLAGLFLDRVGLQYGSSLAVAAWSLVGMSTALVTGFRSLLGIRALLGITESAGIPGTGKASAVYLKPEERALGSAVSQVGLTLGGLAAPLLAEFVRVRYGWRSAFVVAGALGFVWIPIWLAVARRVPEQREASRSVAPTPVREVIADRQYWAMLAANILLMTIYSLWVNWTTVFLVRVHGVSQHTANVQLAWIPPIFATAGGLFGGWLAFRWIRSTGQVVPARMRAFLTGCLLCLGTALVPLAGSPALATVFICLSFFACVLASVNLYSLPIDMYGPGRAAFAVSGLTAAYGLVQGIFSSIVGRVVDRAGFTPVCLVVAVLPIVSWGVLRLSLRRT